MINKLLNDTPARVVTQPFVHAARMPEIVLSVKEAVATLHQNILDACYDDEDIRVLISAVRREQDLIATKRERERVVEFVNESLKKQNLDDEEFILPLTVWKLEKKILGEK